MVSTFKKIPHSKEREENHFKDATDRGGGNNYLWSVWSGDQPAQRNQAKKQTLNLHDETNFNWWNKFYCHQSNSLASNSKSALEVKNSYLHFQCYYLRCPFSYSYFTKEWCIWMSTCTEQHAESYVVALITMEEHRKSSSNDWLESLWNHVHVCAHSFFNAFSSACGNVFHVYR